MLINGERRNDISASDRGLSYGDGLFETIRLHCGKAVLMDRHLKRLCQGLERLRIPLDPALLLQDLATFKQDFPASGVLKIIVTRGSGGRGYQSPAEPVPTRIMSIHPLPDLPSSIDEQGVDIFLCRQTLASQPSLAGLKHLNRLEQVLASLEWPTQENCFEGLMLDMTGNPIEGTKSNVFWAQNGRLFTPDLSYCGVAGVMRAFLLDKFKALSPQQPPLVDRFSLQELLSAEEVFITNSVFGVVPVKQLREGQRTYTWRPGEFTRQARQWFQDSLENS